MTAVVPSRWTYVPGPDAWDEALGADGRPRPAAEGALAALAGHTPAGLASAVGAGVAAQHCVFHSLDGDHEFVVDPVPRAIAAAEWDDLARGLSQRIRALNAFVADVHGEQRILAEGAVPERLLEADDEPAMRHVAVPGGIWTAVAGEDIVRDPSGRLVVLEDNLTTPSGAAYAAAARRAVTEHVRPEGGAPRPLDVLPDLLLGALRAVAPGDREPFVIVLTDGPENSAYWEHEWLARAMDVPLATPAELSQHGDELRLGRATVDVVYRRSDADRLDDEVGQLLGPPLRAGRLGVANAYGTSVADDKLAHAYVAAMIAFYLGEEPLLPAVETLDLARPEHLERALDTLAELVVKPRRGHGGIGVVIAADASPSELEALRERLRADPGGYVAQPRVPISRHPTVVGDRVQPRHVDLRPFVFLHGPDDARVLPGGLTRVALDEGALVVNSTQNGGAKDTWVL